MRIRFDRGQKEPEQIVDAVEEPDEKDVLFRFLGLFVFLTVIERLERVADRAVALESHNANICGRTVDREKGEVDVNSAG